ncbi:MAG: PilW family protein [Methylibium sp.]|nr:PilW family protein [Methylibium sp.]
MSIPLHHRAGRKQHGFTLIELMVGVVIALLSTLVIAQTLVLSEGQKRSTTNGSDAQVNGALALYTVQREAQMAGYGLGAAPTSLGCPIRAQFGAMAVDLDTLVPVTITNGVDGAADTIRLLSSSKINFSVPTQVVVDHPKTAANFFVNTTLGINEGDLMVVVPEQWDADNWCSVVQVTNDAAGGGGGGNGNGGGQGQNQVIHNSGTDGPWNQPGGQTIFPDAGYPKGSYLINLGQIIDRTFAVTAGNALQQTTFNVTAPAAPLVEELFPHIVQLQAYYGKDTSAPADGVVDVYDDVTPTTQAGWAQVLTVRVAVVARSAQREREIVTTVDPSWNVGTAAVVSGAAACAASAAAACVSIKVGEAADEEWKHYRYKLFDTVIPLRNVLWQS